MKYLEYAEKTGLEVTGFVAAVKRFEYTNKGRGRTLQLDFLVKVKEIDGLEVEEEQHQAFGSHSKDEIEVIEVTEATWDILRDGFGKEKGGP